MCNKRDKMADKAIVTVNEGKIRGIKKSSSFSGTEYYSFLGVPYAQSTEGHARFKDPVKVKPWKDVLDATIEKEGCRQFSVLQKEISGSEDCLYNNIYTKSLKANPSKPVVVNIHPGGLLFGSADPRNYGSPDYVIHHDIVYVCISYRLHILGFLNLGLKECSGNQGLKDIIMSLVWIRNNISVFGGDPNNVTLMGSSSGSALVHFLMLSPRAKGLFHKAVLMGMYITNPTVIFQRENTTSAFDIAKSLGYGTDQGDKKKLLSYLKRVPIDTMIMLKAESSLHQVKVPLFPASPFLPTTDHGENAVLPLSPEELIPLANKIPLMIGFCNNEAAIAFIHQYKKITAKNFFTTVRQNPWGWGSDLNEEELKQIQKEIETFYLNGGSVENAPLATKCAIQTDIALSDVYDSVININADSSPVYVYRFDYEGNFSTMKDRIMEKIDEPLKGTVHGCDYSYWSFIKDFWSLGNYVLTAKSREMIEKFTKLITTFAKTGNPNYQSLDVPWKPTIQENPCFLSIDDPMKLIHGKINAKRMEFWENVKKRYAKKRFHKKDDRL